MLIDVGSGCTHLRVGVGVGGHVETRRTCGGGLWRRMRQLSGLILASSALARSVVRCGCVGEACTRSGWRPRELLRTLRVSY